MLFDFDKLFFSFISGSYPRYEGKPPEYDLDYII